MPRPEVSDASEDLYAALSPAFATPDEATEWSTLKFCAALVSGDIDFIYEIVTDSAFGPGWQILLDPARCPVQALPYLAQFVGAVLTPDMDEAARREAIESPQAFRRGTPAAIVAVAKRRLTGTKTVLLVERYTGLAWRTKIVTIESETPEPAATLADIIREQKPIGIRLYFNSAVAWNYKELAEEKATYTVVEEAFATYGALTTDTE